MNTDSIQEVAQLSELPWNRLAWFGGVAGASMWMLCTGIFLTANQEFLAGVFPLASAILICCTGLIVWKRRDLFTIHFGLMVLLIVSLVGVSVAIILTFWLAIPELLDRMKWPSSPIPLIAPLTVILGAGIWVNYSQWQKTKFHPGHNAE